MLKNHIVHLLTLNLTFELTESQQVLIEKLAAFIVSGIQDSIFLIRGYAGTGKTTMINQLVKVLETLNINSVLLAPTGRAAKVLTSYTGNVAYTIHKKIYRQRTSVDGLGTFSLDKNLHRNTYFIVDESSMVPNESGENIIFGSGKLLDDLLEYVFSGLGCRLVLVGDTAQLPPVGLSLSPALSPDFLTSHGFTITSAELNDVVRQEQDSAILLNATRIRQRIAEEQQPAGFFPIILTQSSELQRIKGNELIEKIATCYDTFGITETTVLTRSNKRANLYNKGIRGSILYRDAEIARGDLLMVVRNNYHWTEEDTGIDFIANGDVGEITHIYGFEEMHGFRFANISLRLTDYDAEVECKIVLDALESDTASLSRDESLRLFNAVSEDYSETKNKRERWKKIKLDPYYNALQVKFAYAVTCHKAQGGQWQAVFIDTGYITEEMIDREYLRWLYTAFTRPARVLYLVNFDNRFFDNGTEY